MSGSVNKVIDDLYRSGLSIPKVASRVGKPLSTVRYQLKKSGLLRSRAEGVRLAASIGDLGAGLRGKKRTFTQSHKRNISKAAAARGKRYAVGVTLKPNGYLEYTRGPHKGRLVHCVEMEARLGRRLRPGECVHHIDGNKINNHEDNLALLTRSGHARLHRREEKLAKQNEVKTCQEV